jgi:hypothetical protein
MGIIFLFGIFPGQGCAAKTFSAPHWRGILGTKGSHAPDI